MGTDIVDVAGVNVCFFKSHPHRSLDPIGIRGREIDSVRRKTIAANLTQNSGVSLFCDLIIFQDDRRRSAAGNQSIAVMRKWPGGLFGLVVISRKGVQRIKTAHRMPVDLLCAAADNATLFAAANQVRRLPDRMTAAAAR